MSDDRARQVPVAPPDDDFCRSIESYLCRKNDGHLIRIVGPAFDAVCAWAERGVPLKVAYRGIDRYFERYYAKGTRRRPVRVEFCEADVLDVFDEWRRAVGVSMVRESSGGGDAGGLAAEDGSKPHASLKAHLERTRSRLAAVRAEGAFAEATAGAIEALRALADRGPLRGEARRAVLEQLKALDASLLESARAQSDGQMLAGLTAEAEAELAPFRARMPAEAYAQSRRACVDRLVRERFRLPVLSFD